MEATRREVLRTVGIALLLLAPCLAAWYFVAGVVGWPPARLAAPVVKALAGPVQQMETARTSVAYTVRIEGPYRPGGSPRADARVEVPAANYTFGIAVYLALVLAVKGWREPVRLAIGLAILLPLPVVGIAADALRQLGAAAQLAPLLAWGPGRREAIALAYQVGSLLLPTLAPIVAWLALFWFRPGPAATANPRSDASASPPPGP